MTLDLTMRIIFLLSWIVFGGIRIYYGRKSPWAKQSRSERFESIKQDGLAGGIFLLVLFYSFFFVAFLYLIDFPLISWSYFPLIPEIRIVGIIFGVLSFPYIHWAHKTLGTAFTATIQTQESSVLMVKGPFARVRHPMYSSHTLFNLGMVLVSANLIILAYLVVGMPFTYRRMFKEEENLIQDFGEEYKEYMKRTGRIFPKTF
ncbi:MAG: isoprenylcysteine carboxylmethyltransferase family protein [Candidatus Thorarchaeota archaeon]|jgi:protein-S-isoprenylcysteine O-methyltransferase Ste14